MLCLFSVFVPLLPNLVTMVLCYGDNQNSTKYQGKSNTHHQLLIQPSEPHHFHSFYQRLNIRTLPKYQVILWFLPHTFGCSEVIFLSQTLPHTLIWIILYHDLPQLWLLSLCTQFCVSSLFLSFFSIQNEHSHFWIHYTRESISVKCS